MIVDVVVAASQAHAEDDAHVTDDVPASGVGASTIQNNRHLAQ